MPPDPRVIDYFFRHGMGWRVMARMWESSTGTLGRAYDQWLHDKGWTRAEIRAIWPNDTNSATVSLTAPARTTNRQKRFLRRESTE